MNDLNTQNQNQVEHSTAQHDYILLDGSGSMIGKWDDSLLAIDAYVAGVRAGHIQSNITLHIFDSNDCEYLPLKNQPIKDWIPLAQRPFGAHWGGTPLYDAIQLMGRSLRDLNPPRASIVIVTDGAESGSQFTDLTQARAILDWMRAKGWQVTFIGADINNSATARELGASEASAIGVQTRMLSDAARTLAAKRARYGHSGENMEFNKDEKQQFGGYLSAPGAKEV